MKNPRIISYDLFRGVLLIGMVIFHILVNLTSLQFDQRQFYFVPAGFILFLGVILAYFLKNRTGKKLVLSVKLLAIFLLLNIPNFIAKDFTVLDFISGDPRIFSFEILFPMTVMILLTLLTDKVDQIKSVKLAKSVQLLILALFLLLLSILNHFDIFYYNLIFTIYGLIGYFAASLHNLDQSLQQFQKTILKKIFALVFFALITIIPFFILHFFKLYDLLIILQIFAMYFAFNIIIRNNKPLTLLGKHSLLLYVGHIVIIKLLSKFL